VVLNFWATWCAPCREEMPLLASVQQHYAASGVQVIGASVDDPSTRNSVLEFARRFKLNFPVWLGATLADMQRIGLGGALPATAILDRDGRVAARLIGMAHRASLTTRIDWLLSDRRTPSFPSLVNTIEKDPHAAGHEHGGEEHDHAVIALEGASTVPS
jgi:thiol-disulfide isomerase/thioredoxin